MLLKNRIIKAFILSIYLLASILSQNIEYITFDGKNKPHEGTKSTTYEVKIEKLTQSYLHIKVNSDISTSPYITYSNTDNKCQNSRKQLIMNPYGNLDLIIKGTQIPNEKKIFICVHCQIDNCSYKTQFLEESEASIDISNQYNYYISEENKEMNFVLKKNINYQYSSNSFIIIWIKGSLPSKINFDSNINILSKRYFSNNGNIFIIKNIDNYKLNVLAEKEDYISIGSNVVEEGKSKELKINDLETFGYLKKGVIEEMCFPIEKSGIIKEVNDMVYITGLIYTKIAKIYYKDENNGKSGEREILDGNIIEINFYDEIKGKSFCVSLINNEDLYNANEVVFSLQLVTHKYNNYNQFIYQPQLPGVIYPHILLKGEVAVFTGMNSHNDTKEINYNMKSITGFPKMYFYYCETYPNCIYDNEKRIMPTDLNRMTVYNIYMDDIKKKQKEINPINSYQPILIVNCTDGNMYKKEQKEGVQYCIFETSIFTDKDNILIKEGETYTQFLLSKEADKYSLSYDEYKNVEKIFLDLILFSGDVKFNIITRTKREIKPYFLSSKIFYSIKVEDLYSTEKKIDFSIIANKNSFYMVQYQLVYKGDQSNQTNLMESGVNYIESIEATLSNQYKYKYIEISNFRVQENFPFLANFYSQNCKFNVSRCTYQNGMAYYKQIDMYDNYGQDIIEKNDPIYSEGKYRYKVEVIRNDTSFYERRLCMIYISGLELDEGKILKEVDREISVSEGVPQYFIFDQKHKKIKYAYYVSDITKSIVINFNLIDKTSYFIDILYQSGFGFYELERNDEYIIKSDLLQEACSNKEEVCAIKIEITLMKNETISSRLETTFSQINGSPSYLERNTVRRDVLVDKYKYYYLDIGEKESGDVTVDFKRGSAKIYGSIVAKSEGWRGKYNFPSNGRNLRYDTYSRQLLIDKEDTSSCRRGCYLLLKIVALDNINNITKESVVHRFSIYAKILPRRIQSIDNAPKVKILVNDFVFGKISPSSEVKYDFYKVWLPYDSDEIFIDWQADMPNLYINIGDKRPQKGNAHFTFNSIGHDTVFKIKKNQLLDICQKENICLKNSSSIKDMNLVLGISTDKVDSFYYSVYAFKIFIPPLFINSRGEALDSFELLHVRSNQKVQCLPFTKWGTPRCLFAIIFDKNDISGRLAVYLQSQKYNEQIEFYASFLDSHQIEKNNFTYIYENLPDYGKHEISSEKKEVPYIHIDKISSGKCLLINATPQSKSIIEILSSIYTYNEVVIPNPSTPQLFAIKNENLKLDFATTKDLLINIKSLVGGGRIFWEGEQKKYYLHGANDKISLTSGTTNPDKQLAKLVINSGDYIYSNNEPGFIFYVTFYPRNYLYDIDLVKIGSSVEFNYRNSTFPIYFFSKLSYSSDMTLSLNFYNFESNSSPNLQTEGKILDIWAKIISEEEAYNARFNEGFKPLRDNNCYSGTFDNPFGNLVIPEKEIEKYLRATNKEAYIFFAVEASRTFNKFLSSISVEFGIFMSEDENEKPMFAPEKVYVNGIYRYIQKYKFRVNKNKPYIRIEFSSNNNQLVPYLDNNGEKLTINGRTLYTFKLPESIETNNIGLEILYKGASVEDKYLHYTFKYITSDSKSKFKDFSITNDDLTVTKMQMDISEYNYIIKFNPISCRNCDITYIVKAIPVENYDPKEEINTIAISEMEGILLQVKNPEINKDNRISLKLEKINKNIKCITVLAKIQQLTIYEMVLYKPQFNFFEKKNELIELKFDSFSRKVSYSSNELFKKQNYKLIFDGAIPEYIKIESKSKISSSHQILYFSPVNDYKNNRQQLAQEPYKNITNMWIKKQQFQNSGENLYFMVECIDKDCDYDLNIYGQDYIETNSNFAYSFNIDKNNQEIKLRVKNDDKNANYLVFYTLGDIISLNLNVFSSSQYNSSFGSVIVFERGYNEYYNLEIKAKEGTFITIGGRGVTRNGRIDQILEINGLETFGYLIKNQLKEECHSLPDFYNLGRRIIVNDFYITGIFSSNLIEIIFRDNNYKELKKRIVAKDKIILENYKIKDNEKFICVRFNKDLMTYNLYDTSYILQITNQKHKIGYNNMYSPQISGKIYPRIIPKGTIAYFTGSKTINKTSQSNLLNYQIIALEGNPQMLIHECANYPLCEYNYKTFDAITKIFKPQNNIGMTNNWNTLKTINSPIESEQNAIVVKCNDTELSGDYCKFYTIIYNSENIIELVEKLPFSKNIDKKEINIFKIDFSNEIYLHQIFIDILIVTGDVTVNLMDENNNVITNARKYYLGNKIYFVLDKQYIKNNVLVKIQGEIYSYFIIDYQIIPRKVLEKNNYLYSGINYLVSIDSQMMIKKIKLYKHLLQNNNPFLVNFYSLNCKLNIVRNEQYNEKKINFNKDLYAQDINKDLETEYNYTITISDEDSANYDKSMCMLYVNGHELSDNQREILLNENYPQKIVFDGFKKIRYLYLLTNDTRETGFYLNNHNFANYSVKIIYDGKESETKKISIKEYIFLNKDMIYKNCQYSLCKIFIEIELLDELNEKIKPTIDIIAYRNPNVPFYLQKGITKKLFINGKSPLYLYTDIKKNDKGYIMVDYIRGSGKIYGRIVEKNKMSNETNAIWQGFAFPDEKNNYILFDYYSKKLLITPEHTKNCENDCILLVSIKYDIYGNGKEGNKVYPINIIAYNNTDIKVLSKIKIRPEKYIVGSVSLKNNTNDLYELYEMTIPNDAEKIQFELFSDILELYINVGYYPPTKIDSDFKFNSLGNNNTFEISKKDILNIAENKMLDFAKKDSIEKFNLIIGVGSELSKNLENNIYSFKIHIPPMNGNELDIHKISSDHKTLCKPKSIGNNKYQCLFMILCGPYDYLNNLIIYANSKSKKSNVNIYANYMKWNIYNGKDKSQLREKMPNANFKINEQTNDYIFFSNLEQNSHIYVNVLSDSPDDIEFVSSFYKDDNQIIPNPYSKQIYYLKNENITFSFSGTKNVLINLLSVAGDGKIYWESEPDMEYSLRGRDDRLSLTSKLKLAPRGEKSKSYKLVIKNNNFKEKNSNCSIVKSNNEKINSGFLFLIDYQLRSPFINFDEIFSGKTFEFSHRNVEFPLYFYSKIDNIDYDINIFIIFHNLELKPQKNKKNKRDRKRNTIVDSAASLYSIKAGISKLSTVYDVKESQNLKYLNLSKVGNYFSDIKIAQIILTQQEIKNFNINKGDNPTLFLGIEKIRNSTNNNFKRVTMEISVLKENSDEITTEKMYQYGKILSKTSINSYKLKMDKTTKFMRIQFASNSKNIIFSINDKKGVKENLKDIQYSTKSERGKTFITFKKPENKEFLYLNVFVKDENKFKEKLNNYVFKYINAEENVFIEYPIYKNNSAIKYQITKGKRKKQNTYRITATFNKIEKDLDILYTLKAVTSSKLSEEEESNTIAITESDRVLSRIKNPKDNNGIITMSISLKNKDAKYIQVIAQIIDGPITEYVSYDSIKVKYPMNYFLIILVAILAILLVIGIIIFTMYYRKKHINLYENVNKVSFQESRAEENKKEEDKVEQLLLDDDNKAIN